MNEISFFSLNKASDWEKGRSKNMEISHRGLVLKNSERYGVYRIIRDEEIGLKSGISDYSVGPNGLLYYLDEESNLWIYDYENRSKTRLFSAGHSLFSSHALLATGKNTLFLADPAAEAAIWAFALSNGQLLWRIDQLLDQSGSSWLPLAIAVTNDESILVLALLQRTARNLDLFFPSEEQLGVFKIDAGGQVLQVAADPEFCLRQPGKPGELTGSMAISAGPDNGIYVLAAVEGKLYKFDAYGRLHSSYRLTLPVHPSGLCIDSHNFIYIGDGRRLGKDAEDDRHILKFSPSGQLLEKIEGFRGRTEKLLIDARNRVYIWNREASALNVMTMKKVNEKDDNSGLAQGVYLSTALDSTTSELEWHRITLEAEIPEDTQIKLYYLASDQKEFIINGHYIDLDEFIKDEIIPLPEKLRLLAPLWSKALINPRDSLLHSARGRYLWLMLEFNGSEKGSPELKKIRVYYPRISYLEYLPAVYQEDEESRDFLERFLSIFSTFMLDMEEEINHMSRCFDAQAAAGPFLDWLAGWLGIAVDESWQEEQLRQLVMKAPEIYSKRGSREAIEEIISIYAGEKPLIVEHFQYKYLQEEAELKRLMTRLYGQDPYCFHVLVKQEHLPTAAKYAGLQKILNEEKPAFTQARLIVLQPWIYMDMHTYLGINTFLSELSLLRLDQKSSIPYSSVLVDVDQANRFDIHSRMELDAELK